MWYQFENIIYTPSVGASESDNTDWSLSGVSKKFTFTNIGDTITIDFDLINLTLFEEISMQIYSTPNKNGNKDIFEIQIDGVDYSFDAMNKEFKQILFDTAGLSALTKMVITSNVENLIMFFDLFGYRIASPGRNIEEVFKSIANTITLDYNASTVLTSKANIGTRQIRVADKKYMLENTIVKIGGTELAELDNKDGLLKRALSSSFSVGDTVEIICPVRYGDAKRIDNNPVCGIVLYDRQTTRPQYFMEKTKQGITKRKAFNSKLYILIYLESSYENKLFELIDRFEYNYGEQFSFILDGQKVDLISIDSGSYLPSMIGNYPRMTYRYSFCPQPLTIKRRIPITTQNLTLEVSAV